jgi:hypothetical protein
MYYASLFFIRVSQLNLLHTMLVFDRFDIPQLLVLVPYSAPPPPLARGCTTPVEQFTPIEQNFIYLSF